MNTSRLFVFPALFVACMLCFAPVAAAASKPGWPMHVRLLTGPAGGQWFVLGESMAKLLSKDVLLTTSRMGGGIANIDAIGKKSADVAFTLTCFMGAGQSGVEEYKAISTKNTAILAQVYPQVLYFLLHKEFAEKHGITDVGSLLAKKIPLRFASLKPGTASEFIVSMLFKHGYNTNFDKLRAQGWQIFFNNYAETADNFVAGNLDCFGYTAGTTVPLIKTMEALTDVIVLPVEQKVLDLLAGKFKTSTYVIQPGTYKGVTTPVATLGDYTSLVVRQDLPNDLVFEITRSLWQHRGQIASVISDFAALSPTSAIPAGIPAHPGAAAFWRQAK